MIPTLVFSEWTSTSSSVELEREFKEESTEDPDSESSKESLWMKPSNGSPRSALELSSDQDDRRIVIDK
jgi:hypothetical protein